ncbi:MAG: hypothetical protein HFH23_17325, partial [Ruminococcus sp.]|nr:hypothetical protein [Ruminococcus sp.]
MKKRKDGNGVAKKKMAWWKILLIVLLVILVLFCGMVGFSVFMIKKFTGDSLSIRGMMAMAGYVPNRWTTVDGNNDTYTWLFSTN